MRSVRLLALVSALSLGAAAPAAAKERAVGHRVEHLKVPNSVACPGATCDRSVAVHLWYPADRHGFERAAATEYTSALHDKVLPAPWAPLRWKLRSSVARETDAVDAHGKPLPVIVFSHGSVNDPIDYAPTLEALAAEGFVVAAPYHAGNTQDDVRIDYINGQAGTTLFACNDGLPAPCSRPVVANSMLDRSRDISSILDALPDWFGGRADASRAGVLGHSRGTVTALASAGGSTAWGVAPEPRVKAVMGMAIGVAALTNLVDLASVNVPTVLVAGGKDQNSVQAVSESAFATISSADKLFVALPNATHRSFDSNYCAEMQSAAAAVNVDSNAILDRHTVGLIASSAPNFLSGKAVHYCAPAFFAGVETVVGSVPNAEYACDAAGCGIVPPTAGPPSPCVTTTIPCTGLETEEVRRGMTSIAADFFKQAFGCKGRVRFKGHLSPEWLMKHVPMIGEARTT